MYHWFCGRETGSEALLWGLGRRCESLHGREYGGGVLNRMQTQGESMLAFRFLASVTGEMRAMEKEGPEHGR